MGVVVKSVKWTSRALKDIKKIIEFNSQTIGKEKALITAHKLIDAPKVLENTTYDFKKIGTVDEAFSHLKHEYRKLYYKHYKITYRIGKTHIYITRVFDMRQNPSKNK